MRVVILGGSKFGAATADALIEHGHEVVLIDRDRAVIDRLAERMDCGFIEGDGTSPAVLREAFSGDDDVLITLTNASDDNILSALVGRSIGFARVIPQIIMPELLEVCAELDLKDTITPHVTVARSLCKALEEKTEVTEDLNLSNELRLKRIDVGDGADGKTLSEITLPEHARAIAVIVEQSERLATPDTTLAKGNHVLCVAAKGDVEALAKAFR